MSKINRKLFVYKGLRFCVFSLLRDLITQHNDLLGDVSGGGATTGDLTGVFLGTFDLLYWMNMFFENYKDDDSITELSQGELESWFNALDMFQKKNFESNGCGVSDSADL